MRLFEWVMSLWLVAIALWIVYRSIHWPIVHDGAILSYIVFLIDHGRAPYKDIVEMSFPGSYMIYWAAIHLLGPSALAFRLFDLFIMALAAVAMIVIARPQGLWFAGVLGGVSFFVSHAYEGPTEIAQRDLIMAALLLAGCAFTFEAARRARPFLFFWAGFAISLATCMKPTAFLFLLIPACALVRLHRQGQAPWSYLRAGLFGAFVPVVGVVIFLVGEGSFTAFFNIVRRLDTVYAVMPSYPLGDFFFDMFRATRVRQLLFVAAILWAAQRTLRQSFEQQMVLLGVVLGAASYLIQHKGFGYHMLPFIGFSSLWVAMVLVATLHQPDRIRYVGAGLLALLVFALLPRHLDASLRRVHNEAFLRELQADLTTLGADQPGSSVQCMEQVSGCANVLYRMHLVQTTGFVTDFYFFLPERFPVVLDLRRRFLREIDGAQTRILILTDDQYPSGIHGYDQLARWPEFAQYLTDHFHQVSEHKTRTGNLPAGYRIYVRN